MRYITSKHMEPGMCLAQALYDSFGRTLIGQGCELTDVFIKRISEYGIDGVYIEDEISQGIVVEEIITPQLRSEGIECVKACNIDGCRDVAKRIVESVLERGVFVLDMIDLRTYDDYTFAHSVNVAVVSCIIGMGLEMELEELNNIVTAALLHDLGKLSVPVEILNKPERLTPDEFRIMKTHAELSYELIKKRWDISAHIKEAVLHHHENVDGSGYPHGLDGSQQSIYSKILHVADVYDALVSKRPYKEPYSPAEAVEYLMGGCGILFDKTVVETLIKYVPLYPKGTMVRLSDGREGIVFKNSGKYNRRPVIRLLTGEFLDMSLKENFNLVLKSLGDRDIRESEKLEKARLEMIKPVDRKKVMIVDDMMTNLQMLRAILESQYELILMKTGRQAISYIQKGNYPDLVIMDVDMPEMDGVEATKRINEISNGTIPVLFVTALSDRNTVVACKEVKAAGYILRPYKPIYVKGEVERIVQGRSGID